MLSNIVCPCPRDKFRGYTESRTNSRVYSSVGLPLLVVIYLPFFFSSSLPPPRFPTYRILVYTISAEVQLKPLRKILIPLYITSIVWIFCRHVFAAQGIKSPSPLAMPLQFTQIDPEVPDSLIVGITPPQRIVMIAWAYVQMTRDIPT